MKFLITPNYAAPYDQRMVEGLARGFRQLGREARALASPVTADELVRMCREQPVEVVIQVNRTRDPQHPLPPGVRHVSWFQDVFPETLTGFSERFQDADILYALGDPGVLGLDVELPCYVGSLVSGVDPEIFEYRNKHLSEPVDFSLCGFIPPPLSRKKSLLRSILLRSKRKESADIFVSTVEENYGPLSGDLKIHELADAIRANVQSSRRIWSYTLRLQDWLSERLGTMSPLDSAISYFTREYPRQLDRIALLHGVLQVSDSLELFGPGWVKHPRFRPYAKGVIETQEGLLDVYLRSRINLANNTHGLGLHSRTLECMAVGGFVFNHESPHDDKPGGMLTSFEPGVHYGSYTLGSIADEAERWLVDNKQRVRAGGEAAEIVRERHCWHHRASQIIDDLNK